MARSIDTVRDAVVARIQEGWTGSPATVNTTPTYDFDNDRSPGRRVQVVSDGESDEGPVTREKDRSHYRVRVTVTELYTPAGPVPDAWLGVRVAWVKTEVWAKLVDARNPLTLADPDGTAWPLPPDQAVVFDADRLRSDKRFVTETVFTFRVEE